MSYSKLPPHSHCSRCGGAVIEVNDCDVTIWKCKNFLCQNEMRSDYGQSPKHAKNDDFVGENERRVTTRPLFKSFYMEGSDSMGLSNYESQFNFGLDKENEKTRVGASEALQQDASDFIQWQAEQRESKRVWQDPRSDSYSSQESELTRYRAKELQKEGREP
jgi:hypothetical protein